MATYYGFLWLVGALNLLRVFVQIAQTETQHPTLWNWMWIATRFGAHAFQSANPNYPVSRGANLDCREYRA